MAKKKIDLEETIQDNLNYHNFAGGAQEDYTVKSIPRYTIQFLNIIVILFAIVFSYRVYVIQIVQGEQYTRTSIENTFEETIVFSKRGKIYDRKGEELAWNVHNEEEDTFVKREYTHKKGTSHILGYVSYPKKDNKGIYFRTKIDGVSGIEKDLDTKLEGINGAKIIETNATGEVIAKHITKTPLDGNDVTLTIDSDISDQLYREISEIVVDRKFEGGAGALMDLKNGDIISLVSYPEFDSNILSEGEDTESISKFVEDDRKFFLNRTISGLFSPGSVVKPFVAIGALQEGIVSPNKTINVTGSISIPHPYIEDEFSVFKDWRAHGVIDLKDAIAVSSNIYFYTIGGGFEDQEGLGIKGIKKYFDIFKLSEPTRLNISIEPEGVIPTPQWKKRIFDDNWRVGDTYNTAIGQYGVQTTPLQILRGVSGIATGHIVEPKIVKDDITQIEPIFAYISEDNLDTVRAGMRKSVTHGIAAGLYSTSFHIAAKTGTAEVGNINRKLNSWVVGYFPYKNPRYAFTIMVEKGPTDNTVGAVLVAKNFFEWLELNKPEVLQGEDVEYTNI